MVQPFFDLLPKMPFVVHRFNAKICIRPQNAHIYMEIRYSYIVNIVMFYTEKGEFEGIVIGV